MTEGAVADHGDAMRLAPGNDAVLDAAFLQVVEHLIAGDAAGSGDAFRLVEVVRVEIADAPRADLAGAHEILESGDCFRQRVAAAPVQQVAIEPVGLQAGKRCLAGGDRAPAGRVLGHHLGDQEDRIATAGNRLADDRFGRTAPVEFGRVDVAHAKVEAAPQGRDGACPRRPLEIPRALADDRDRCLHRSLLYVRMAVLACAAPCFRPYIRASRHCDRNLA